MYDDGISADAVMRPELPEHSDAVYARYPLLVEDKQYFLAKARERRIELSGWYNTPVHPLAGSNLAKVHYVPGSCPNAENANGRIVSMPTHIRVKPKHIDSYVSLFN
jgi:dTDP-4-amino-4,6-dideoxygalactose transaminase